MFCVITFIIGLLLYVGVCNDTATFSQILCFASIGLFLMFVPMLFCKYNQYILEFVAPNGKHQKVRAYNLIGKFLATRHYTKLGYKLVAEWELA
jgi:uncharacterized membrane protein YtjA (UPF0391 family)